VDEFEEEREALMTKTFKYTKGWVYLDFPSDITLAKKLELQTTGFRNKEDKIN